MGKYIICDDEMFEYLIEYKWAMRKDGYVSAYITGTGRNGSKALVHRVIANCPIGMVVDHIDGNKLNNQKSNLRICTQGQNLMNKRKTRGVSKYKGVYWNGIANKWVSIIRLNGKGYNLGYFSDEESAGKAYDIKAKKLFGEFANFNFNNG